VPLTFPPDSSMHLLGNGCDPKWGWQVRTRWMAQSSCLHICKTIKPISKGKVLKLA
jgi:hypothetical protein